MKDRKRIRAALNFFALTVLFFALYLNFIHKESKADLPVSKSAESKQTVLINNPDNYLKTEHHKLPGHVTISNAAN